MGSGPPPLFIVLWKKYKVLFFLKIDHFLSTYCIFTIKNPKKLKLLLYKQIFASSDAITAATRKILSTTRTILALTWFCHLSMYL